MNDDAKYIGTRIAIVVLVLAILGLIEVRGDIDDEAIPHATAAAPAAH